MYLLKRLEKIEFNVIQLKEEREKEQEAKWRVRLGAGSGARRKGVGAMGL